MIQKELFPKPDARLRRNGPLVFCWSYRHAKTGRIIRSKSGKPFCFPAYPRRK